MKKEIIFSVIILGIITIVFNSCASYGITYQNGKAWSAPEGAQTLGCVQIGSIDVDKPGGAASIEREINALLPILFWEKGYIAGGITSNADYIVNIYARERDVTFGWKTKKSISIEVIFLPIQNVQYAASENKTPFAIGRTVITGTAGLSVSGNLEKLLRKTVKKAVEAASKTLLNGENS